MVKTLTALATAAAITTATMALPTAADARGGRVAAGVIGGLAASALIGGAIANSGNYGYAPGYYGYGPGYYGYYSPGYYGAGFTYYGDCSIQNQQIWDGFSWRIQPVQVC